MPGYEHLNQLAVDYALNDMTPEVRDRAYQELYQGAWEYLQTSVPLKVEGMEVGDIVAYCAEKRFNRWINTYDPTKRNAKTFLNYMSEYAKRACRVIFRDSRDAAPSRRMYEGYQAIKAGEARGEDVSELLDQHLYHSGKGLTLVKRTESLLQTGLDSVSTARPMGDGDDSMTLEDTLQVSADDVYDMDRVIQFQVNKMPKRYRSLIEQLSPGTDLRLHEMDFGRSGLRLIDKLVMLDTAFRLTVKMRAS